MEPGADQGIEEDGFLTDRNGRRFPYRRCEYPGSCHWILLSKEGWRIGHAYTVFEGPRLRLGDITVADAFIRPRPWILASLGFRPKPVSYRGSGLGSALLQEVIAWAAARGFREMTGDIYPKDHGTNPRLPRWYARHGFTFTPASGEGKVVGSVRRPLP